MASSKAFLLLGLLLAAAVILSSEVSGRELAETNQSRGSVEEADWKRGHKRCGHGHGHHGHGHGHHGHDHGHHGHDDDGEAMEHEIEGGP